MASVLPGEHLTAQLKALFCDVDANGDKQITWGEFYMAVEKFLQAPQDT